MQPQPTPAPAFAGLPQPEQLRPLLEAALAVMTRDDPAREKASATVRLNAGGLAFFIVSFNDYRADPIREAYGTGPTPDAAIAEFAEAYQPPMTKADIIAAKRAELAALEALS
jgi:hypothetical protein